MFHHLPKKKQPRIETPSNLHILLIQQSFFILFSVEVELLHALETEQMEEHRKVHFDASCLNSLFASPKRLKKDSSIRNKRIFPPTKIKWLVISLKQEKLNLHQKPVREKNWM